MSRELEFDRYLREENEFLNERIELLEEIIQSQRSLITSCENHIDHLKEEMKALLGDP